MRNIIEATTASGYYLGKCQSNLSHQLFSK
nr:MAG TPA: hypothetical protein [Caudoviricetes sp.]